MKKFSGILICTDLDGTLLREDKTISDENMEAINYFMAEGGLFTFVTGRMPNYVKNMYEKIRNASENEKAACGKRNIRLDIQKTEKPFAVPCMPPAKKKCGKNYGKFYSRLCGMSILNPAASPPQTG